MCAETQLPSHPDGRPSLPPPGKPGEARTRWLPASQSPLVGLEQVQFRSRFWEAQGRVTLAVTLAGEFPANRTYSESALLPALPLSRLTSSTETADGEEGDADLQGRAPLSSAPGSTTPPWGPQNEHLCWDNAWSLLLKSACSLKLRKGGGGTDSSFQNALFCFQG